MAAYLDAFRQCFFIGAPTLTEKNLPNQAGRVFIVTGGYAGNIRHLACRITYQNSILTTCRCRQGIVQDPLPAQWHRLRSWPLAKQSRLCH